jgi:hypothetical protein
VAQLVAHLHGMEGVRSSNLLSSTRYDSKIASERPFPEVTGRASLHDPYGIGTAIMESERGVAD